MTVSTSWLNSHILNITYTGLYDREQALEAYRTLLASPNIGLRAVIIDFTEAMFPNNNFESIFAIADEELRSQVIPLLGGPNLQLIAFIMPANEPLRKWLQQLLENLGAIAQVSFFEAFQEALDAVDNLAEPPVQDADDA